MKRRDHKSVADAIREAAAHDFLPIHRRDGLHVLSDGKRKVAIARETRARSVVFHLVDEFPADTSATLEETPPCSAAAT